MCIVIVNFPASDVINFEINLSFLIKPSFSHYRKNQDKNLNILRTKRVLKMKLKGFFIIFKRLSLKQKKFLDSILCTIKSVIG